MPCFGAVRSILQSLVRFEYFLEVPTDEAVRFPPVEVGCSGSFGDRRVDGRAAAEHLAALRGDRIVERARLAHVTPVKLAATTETIGIRKGLGKLVRGKRWAG